MTRRSVQPLALALLALSGWLGAVAFARQVVTETRQGTRGPRRHP